MIDGEVNQKLELTLGELKSRFRPVTRRLVLECGGNGRSFFTPQARGNQWTNGGAGCAEWTGVRLIDVLQAAGVKPSAVFTGHYGADRSLADASKDAISRGVPIKKAMDDNNLIVFAMNGQPLSQHSRRAGAAHHSGLARLGVVEVVHPHLGARQGARRPRHGRHVVSRRHQADGAGRQARSTDNFRDLESMPVRSIITSPANGTSFGKEVREVKLRGAAWAGDLTVRRVDVSIDFGATWTPAQLDGRPRTPTTGSAGPRP